MTISRILIIFIGFTPTVCSAAVLFSIKYYGVPIVHVVILGAGTIGTYIASQLILENRDVVIIEKNPETAQGVSAKLDCLVINEDGNNKDTLRRAGIEKADYFIGVTNSDEINMIASGIVSSEFNVPYKIARVRNLDYSRSKILGESFLDIDLIVNPGVEAAAIIGETIEAGAGGGVMLFEKTKIQMRNLFVGATSIFRDKDLRLIRQTVPGDFLVSAIVRKNSVIIPTGATIIKQNDTIYLASTRESLDGVFARSGRETALIKKIVIVGGGTIGTLAAQDLIHEGYRVKIIEQDMKRCVYLSSLLPEALIINADISDEGIFEEERLFEDDLMVTSTASEELNILTAAYAKSAGIRRTISIVNKSSYLAIASELGIDSTISPKSCAADAILKFLRGKNVESVHSILDGRVEVLEIIASPSARVLGVPLKDLEMPENSLILSVTRNGVDHVPDGAFSINHGDSVLIITKKKSIAKIERLFSR